jgi:hypothetical protein
LILLAGLAGGLAEILWIASYSGAGSVNGAMVAQQVTVSIWPSGAESAFAPALGVVIHLALSIALSAMAVPLLSRIAAKHSGASVMVGSAMLMLAIVWKVNFFIILPLINPAFVVLMPLSVTLASKLLFGMAMGLVMYNAPQVKALSATANRE